MATVTCQHCNAVGDDMDSGGCLSCGENFYEVAGQVFDNGSVKPKKGVSVSSAARLDRGDYRTRSAPSGSASDADWVAYADRLIAAARSNRRPERGPLVPVPGRADRSWLEDSITASARAEDAYVRTLEDLEAAQWQAKQAQAWIDSEHLHERALPVHLRHQYVEAMAKISYAAGCFAAYELARDRHFALLDDLAEASKVTRSVPPRGGLEDPLDPYRDTSKDDGSLRYAQRQAEKAERDRHRDGGARGFQVE